MKSIVMTRRTHVIEQVQCEDAMGNCNEKTKQSEDPILYTDGEVVIVMPQEVTAMTQEGALFL